MRSLSKSGLLQKIFGIRWPSTGAIGFLMATFLWIGATPAPADRNVPISWSITDSSGNLLRLSFFSPWREALSLSKNKPTTLKYKGVLKLSPNTDPLIHDYKMILPPFYGRLRVLVNKQVVYSDSQSGKENFVTMGRAYRVIPLRKILKYGKNDIVIQARGLAPVAGFAGAKPFFLTPQESSFLYSVKNWLWQYGNWIWAFLLVGLFSIGYLLKVQTVLPENEAALLSGCLSILCFLAYFICPGMAPWVSQGYWIDWAQTTFLIAGLGYWVLAVMGEMGMVPKWASWSPLAWIGASGGLLAWNNSEPSGLIWFNRIAEPGIAICIGVAMAVYSWQKPDLGRSRYVWLAAALLIIVDPMRGLSIDAQGAHFGAGIFVCFGFYLYFFLQEVLQLSRHRSALASLVQISLPSSVVRHLADQINTGADLTEMQARLAGVRNLSTVFVDICGWGGWSENLPSEKLTQARTIMFDHVGNIANNRRLSLIKFVGDNMHLCGGLFTQRSDEEIANNTIAAILEMIDNISDAHQKLSALGLPLLQIKISATMGPLKHFLLGYKGSLRFDVEGHWLIVAKRQEEAMNARFYQLFGQNSALISPGLFRMVSHFDQLRRFYRYVTICDKHQHEFVSFVASAKDTEAPAEEDFLQNYYHQLPSKAQEETSQESFHDHVQAIGPSSFQNDGTRTDLDLLNMLDRKRKKKAA